MPGTNLTRVEAQERASHITSRSYHVDIDLTTSPETFRSVTTVRFDSSTPGSSTFLDLIAPSVQALTHNGRALDPATHFDGKRVTLPSLEAQNEVVVDATCAYMTTGEGLHRFVDPVDDEVYLYTQFEVPDSRRIMAVFEQPDLKAEFTFTITGPEHWQVVSNAITPQPQPVRDGVARWSFPATARISSYITAFVAGPYDVVHDSVQTRAGEIPLGVFCRRSMTPHLDADNVLACTKAGFAFFEELFDSPYPFTKYDQLFTPEYNAGAMENAGCVTINEMYVFRSKVSDAMVERRALTILHELAHMWFGDLVTMKWWDDLWLNESFAEWVSTTCQAEATQWADAWTTFCTQEKAWAYRQDQLSTTHPVVAPIRDLHDVETNFDGITYAKGASVLKQLVAYVGREQFVAGLRSYFARYAWGNTTLDDLLSELESASGRDLRSWSAQWLQTSGVNLLRPVLQTDDQGLISLAAIEQSVASGDDLLRPHHLRVASYAVREERFVRTATHDVDIDGARTDLGDLIGTEAPDVLLVNDEDLAYAKVRFDPRSLASVLAHPRGFTDTLAHSLALATLWDMTRDGEMRASDYLPFALGVIEGEEDSNLLRTLLGQMATCLTHYLAPEHRDQARQDVRDRLLELAQNAPPGSDAQLQLVTAYAGLLAGGDDPAYARGLLDGTVVLDGLAVDTDMRWSLVTALAAMAQEDGDLVIAELERDATSTGRERAMRARASRPTAQAKADAWAQGVEDVKTPNSVIQALAEGFNRAVDPSLLQPYAAKFLDAVLGVAETRTHAVAEEIDGFYPSGLAGPQLLAATNRWLADHEHAPASVRRAIAENRDGVARAVNAQDRDRQDA